MMQGNEKYTAVQYYEDLYRLFRNSYLKLSTKNELSAALLTFQVEHLKTGTKKQGQFLRLHVQRMKERGYEIAQL